MTKLLITILLVVATTMTWASTILKGDLNRQYIWVQSNQGIFRKPPFPLENYEVPILYIENINVISPKNYQGIDFKKLNTAHMSGYLKLISYNENTGEIKFKLHPNKSIILTKYNPSGSIDEQIELDASVYFSNDEEEALLIETKVDKSNKMLTLEGLSTNEKFSLKRDNNNILITLNLPIQVTIKLHD